MLKIRSFFYLIGIFFIFYQIQSLFIQFHSSKSLKDSISINVLRGFGDIHHPTITKK